MLKRLFSFICLTISILLLFYTFYKSEIYWSGEKRDYYLIYYFVLGLLIIFSIITFYLNEKIKTYLIIILTSIVFTLYAFEGYLIYYEYVGGDQLNKIIKLYKEQTGKNYDTRTRLEVYKDLNRDDENVVVRVPPAYYLGKQTSIFSLSGISNSKTLDCNENGYYSIYQSDRYGFNNPDSEWDKQVIEYLLVGDSYVHGACVNRPNDISSVLRTLSQKSALNLGYATNGPLIEYATLREYLKPNVKNILWIYFEGNDYNDLENELKSYILVQYFKNLNFSQNLKLKQNEINELAFQMIEREKENELAFIPRANFNLITSLKLYKTRVILKNSLSKKHQPRQQPLPQPQIQFKEILKQANDLAIKNNSKLYFIYLPHYSRYKFNYDNFYNFSYLSVKNIVDELNIPFIDIHKEVFEKETNPLKLFPFEINAHFNVEGYRKVAEAIYKFISK